MPLRSRIGENSSTDSNSRSPLSDETTWPKRGGRTTSHFGDGVSFHRAHTHWCVSLGGKADILEAKLSLASWKPSRSGRVGVFGRSDTHAWRKHRGNEFFIRTSEMRSGPPCALRHWQRLQPASRWRLGSYSFSADRLPTFIVCPHQDPPISPPSLQVSLGCRDDLTQTDASGFVLLRFPLRSSGGCGAFRGGCGDHRRGAPTVSAHHFLFLQNIFHSRLRSYGQTHACSPLLEWTLSILTVKASRGWALRCVVWICVKWRIWGNRGCLAAILTPASALNGRPEPVPPRSGFNL